MELGRFETDHIYCEDSYMAIKELPDKCIDCIYTDIPYFYINGSGGNSELSKRIDSNINTGLKDIKDGIDFDILNEFIRTMKKINIFIWCSKLQILDIMKFFIEKHNCFFEILTWNKTNPTPATMNTWLPDIEYCLYFREKGVPLNDGYELKSKWYDSPINKKDKDKFEHPTIKPLALVKGETMGVPQTRHRVFFIATRLDFDLNKIDLSFNYEPITYGMIKQGELKQMGKDTKFYQIASQANDKDKNIADTRKRLGEKGSAFQTLYIRDDMVVPTQRAKPDLIDLEHIAYVSKETIRNSQTFPQDYKFEPDTYSNIGYICGMSVPPLMIKRIVTRLIESGIFSYKKGEN